MRHWLIDWAQERDLRSPDSLANAISRPKLFGALRERARAELPAIQRPTLTGDGLVAGAGIDLSGRLTCAHPQCRIQQTDALFSHAWHYFDQIAIADPITRPLATTWKRPTKEALQSVRYHFEVVNYVRKIGAESLLVFQDKVRPPHCYLHWRMGAEQAGLGGAVNVAEDLATVLAEDATISFGEHKPGRTQFMVDHPVLMGVGSPTQSNRTSRVTRERASSGASLGTASRFSRRR